MEEVISEKFNQVHEKLGEHGKRLDEHDNRIEDLTKSDIKHDINLTNLYKKFDGLIKAITWLATTIAGAVIVGAISLLFKG